MKRSDQPGKRFRMSVCFAAKVVKVKRVSLTRKQWSNYFMSFKPDTLLFCVYFHAILSYGSAEVRRMELSLFCFKDFFVTSIFVNWYIAYLVVYVLVLSKKKSLSTINEVFSM